MQLNYDCNYNLCIKNTSKKFFCNIFVETAYKNQHCHSAVGEESPPFFVFFHIKKALKQEILHFVQDDRKGSNNVILSVSEESPVFFISHLLTFSSTYLLYKISL
jgi:hypothetical protein